MISKARFTAAIKQKNLDHNIKEVSDYQKIKFTLRNSSENQTNNQDDEEMPEIKLPSLRFRRKRFYNAININDAS